MGSLINEKDHSFPSHNALDPNTVKINENETEAQASERRLNEIANKAAGKGVERQHQDEAGEIFSK